MSVSIKTTRRASDQKVIRGNLSLFVSTKGKDTNIGNVSTKAFRTIEKAFSYLKGFYIAEGASVTINLAAGVYSSNAELVMDHPQGNLITLKGPSSVVQSAYNAKNYTDTTGFSGRVGRLSYTTYQPFLDSELGTTITSGSRYTHVIAYEGASGIPSNASGTYVMISPHNISTGDIVLNQRMNAIGNFDTFGFTSNSTAPDRYLESEFQMQRMFAIGGFKIKTTSRDSVDRDEVMVENYRNRNPYDGVSNSNSGRDHTISDPSTGVGRLSPTLTSSLPSTVPSQYISVVIRNTSAKLNGIRITEGSGLKLENVAIETVDPSTGNASTKTGILAENNSSVILGNGVIVKNFKIGIAARNKSIIRQEYTGKVPFHSASYCGTGVLVSENSQATLKSFVSNGSWERGFVVTQQSEGTFTECLAIGSGTDGFVATRNSNLVALRCVSAYNFQDAAVNYTSTKQGGIGFGSRLNSNTECVSCLSFRNGFGFFTDKNSSMNISGCDSMDNINRGLSVTECSSGVIGPFVHSKLDAIALSVGDNSFSRHYTNTFDFSGVDPANGSSGGNCISVTTNSCVNVFDCQINTYGNNAVHSLYNSSIIADNLGVSGSGIGDNINCTYDSTVRCSNSTVDTSSIYTTALQPGYVEVNGVAY